MVSPEFQQIRRPLQRWLQDERYYLKSLDFLENELFRATAAWVAFENAVSLDLAVNTPLFHFDRAWQATQDYIKQAEAIAGTRGGRLNAEQAKRISAALGPPPVSCFAIYMITVSGSDGTNERCVYIGRTNAISHRFKSGHHVFAKLHRDEFNGMLKRIYLASLWIEDDDDHTFPIEWFRDLDRDQLLGEIEAQLIFDLQPQLNRSGKKRLNLLNGPIHIAIQNTISKCLDAHTIGPDRGDWIDED